jgi:hypothetical protein
LKEVGKDDFFDLLPWLVARLALRYRALKENMKIDELSPNKKNPRKMSKDKKALLKKSMEDLGDVSCIGYNRRTKTLWGGHQRRDILKGSSVKIVNKYDPPQADGTTADGFVVSKSGQKFAFREVDWDQKTEDRALVAANKITGEWDTDYLKVFAKDSDINWADAGFTPEDFKQYDLDVSDSGVDNDAEYVKNTPETTEQIPTDRPSAAKSFDEVEEKTEVVGKRFVIIIDCPDQETKDRIKEVILPELATAGCKVF